MSKRKVPIVATIVVVAAALTMVGLGVWQLDRLAQKEAMIAEFDAAMKSEAPLPWSQVTADPEAAQYRRTEVPCVDASGGVSIAGRNEHDQPGYVHIVTCGTADGNPVEIVLGWSRAPDTPDWDEHSIAGFATLTNSDQIRVTAAEGQAGLETAARPDPHSLPNNHLAYAVQWFFFALTSLVIYVLALRRKWREQG